ncbi:MAG: cation:proton antiporter [Proteiniphilum sp.]|nr:cation:proton antiporter [Proteiniphilum sp.]
MFLSFSLSLPMTNPTVQFLILFIIIFFAPIIFKKIRIPSLIGLIIAGAIIGPFGLSLMLRDSNMIMLGNAGLLYIMFLAGIEIDVEEFKKNSSKSIVFGLITFIIPMIIGFFAGRFLLNLNEVSSILLASMFASHTLIAYPLISKLGAGKNRAVTITIGGTMITDTLALLVLAVIMAMHSGKVNIAFWTQLSISMIIFALVIILLFPIFTRWFFKKSSDSTSQFIFVISMVFLGGFLAELAGVEAIIGAFLAGLPLNKLIPSVSPLMNRIDFVGNAIFIPIFLISVGMLIDYKAFVTGWETVKVAVVMTVVATLSKFIAAYITQKIYGYTNAERKLIFGLSNAQAAATLAAITVAHGVGLLDDTILNGTIVMILVTCTVASLRAQKGAMEAVIEGGELQAENSAYDEKILIPIANKDTMKDLIELSLVIKSKSNFDGVYALNIINSTEVEPKSEKESVKLLDTAVKLGAAAETIIKPLIRYDTNIPYGILGIVRKYNITDLVMGLHIKQEISESFLGNLVEGVLSKTDTTTIIFKAMQPLSTIKRRMVIIPPNADMEIGFPFWLSKVWNLGRNSGTKISFYANEIQIDKLKRIHKLHPIDADFHIFDDWNDFLVLAKELKKDEGVVIIMSRLREASYHETMKRIPDYLNKYFTKSNFMLIYPIQTTVSDDYHNDMTNAAVQASLKSLGGFGQTVASIT